MMAAKITRDVLQSYLACKYKAYLLLAQVHREPSAYEQWLHKNDQQYASGAVKALLARIDSNPTSNKPALTDEYLKARAEIVTGFQTDDGPFAFPFPALKRVPGASSTSPSHHLPVLFSSSSAPITETQKLMVSCEGLILERSEKVRSHRALFVSGDTYKTRTIYLEPHRQKAQKILDDLTHYLNGEDEPRLCLNDHCRSCRYQDYCQAEALQADDLSLLNRISEREVQGYRRKGIFTVNQLSYTFRVRKRGKRIKARGRPHSFPLQALAIREQSVYVVSKPAVSMAATYVYVDMEGSPSGNFIYLIGMAIVENEIRRYQYFWADSKGDEEQIIHQFLQHIASLSNPHLFFYGSYEARIFRRIAALPQTSDKSKSLLTRSTNVLSLIYANIYFPTYSNELKKIGKYLGCNWADTASSGLDTVIWRAQWETSHDPALRDRLITYNRDDCIALQKVTEFLSALPGESEARTATNGKIRLIDKLEPDDGIRSFGRKPCALDEFGLIIKCAYFEYQRVKIYVRTNPSFKNIERRKRINTNRHRLRINKTIDLRAVRCPDCKGNNISRDHLNYHAKDCLDLHISTGGIKRRVLHYRAPFHRCMDCDKAFVPQTFRTKTRFGHGLISWVVDQHIGNRITFENLERTVKDYFHLPVGFRRLHKLKSVAARYYSTTYNNILKKLIGGAIIHADETKVNLQKSSGYVWVLTNMEEVLYLYKPTREADFLHEMLAEFNGVLISDFFTGYDSLRCPKQKCLIHLIRDVNDDLLKNPFDRELKELATLFGQLLRRIIATIDRVGLNAIHLRKHKPSVREFVDGLTAKSFESENAQRYCKRILKYQVELFTFLDHDGVPWNNNNAEHAVKYFAKYRRLTNGRITEPGLTDYLVLLSVYQSCRYKEIGFLDFLLSEGRDIDRFAERHARKASRKADLSVLSVDGTRCTSSYRSEVA